MLGPAMRLIRLLDLGTESRVDPLEAGRQARQKPPASSLSDAMTRQVIFLPRCSAAPSCALREPANVTDPQWQLAKALPGECDPGLGEEAVLPCLLCRSQKIQELCLALPYLFPLYYQQQQSSASFHLFSASYGPDTIPDA